MHKECQDCHVQPPINTKVFEILIWGSLCRFYKTINNLTYLGRMTWAIIF